MNNNNINLLTSQALNEELGYAGVEMFNDKYPSMQDDGGNQAGIKVRSAGDAVVSQSSGDQSTFAKYDKLPGAHGMGDPVLDKVSGKDPVFSHALNLVKSMNRSGDPVVTPGKTD